MCAAACCSSQLSSEVLGLFVLIDLPRRQILQASGTAGSPHGSVAPPGISVFHLGLSSPMLRGLANWAAFNALPIL